MSAGEPLVTVWRRCERCAWAGLCLVGERSCNQVVGQSTDYPHAAPRPIVCGGLLVADVAALIERQRVLDGGVGLAPIISASCSHEDHADCYASWLGGRVCACPCHNEATS